MLLKDQKAASYVGEALRVDSETEIDWQQETEVLVVGYGGAGVCAALEAVENGTQVLAIDRFEGGGATSISGGIVYAGDTPYQQQGGIEDSVEDMYNYLSHELAGALSENTLRQFCEQSSANLAWLVERGVNFGSNVFLGKRTYPPVGYDLYYSGNETAPKFASIAKAAPRGHRVSGAGYTGYDFYHGLKQDADKKGVKFRQQTMATRLIVDASDRVLGVEVLTLPEGAKATEAHSKIIRKVNKFERLIEKLALKAANKARALEDEAGQRQFIRAKNGVVLTTGSFAFNREMVRHYAPKYGNAMPLGSISCDGSGILLGLSVGAAVGFMHSVTAWRSISPSEEFVKSIVVNKSGERFVAEDAYLGHLGLAIAEQPEQRAWLILDSSTYWRAFKEVIPRRGEEAYLEFRGPLLLNLLFNTQRGKTLAKLAHKLGVDEAGLAATLASYNQLGSEQEDAWGKKPANIKPLKAGSYYAIDISVGSKKYLCPTIPMGGLSVDEQTGAVLKQDGSAISGLFAAGRAAVGIPSGFYVSGTSIADCVFSGRRAGKQLAQLKN